MTSNNLAPDAAAPDAPPSPPDERKTGFMELGVALVIAIVCARLFPSQFKTVAIFLATLGLLVFVHEWGHFQFARWAGLKVNRFALGFPPFLYTKRYKGIDYSIGALPIGGMVDIAGLGSEEEMISEVKGRPITPIRRPDRPRGQKQFQDVNLGWRFLTLFAGPLMNFILAITLFIGVYSIAGYPDPIQKAKVETLVSGQPAMRAGIKEGDEIVEYGGKKTPTLDSVAHAIKEGKAAPTTITVIRDSKRLTLPIAPVVRDIYKDGKPVPSIGIGFDMEAIQSFTYEKVSPREAVTLGFMESAGIALRILDTIKRAVTGKLADQEKKSIGGPVKIARVMNTAAGFGWPVLLNIAGMLSVNLGLLNLMPFPALDGGRILFLGYELVMRRPFDPRKESLVHLAGMAMLLSFMLFITLRDVNFLHLFGK